MVNNTNPYVVAMPHLPQPPALTDSDHSDRCIGSSPLWELAEIVAVGSQSSDENVTVRMVTDRATSNYEDLIENGFSLQEALMQLESKGRFKGSVWCRTSPTRGPRGQLLGNGFWVPCDSYVISLSFEHPTTKYCGKAEYYLKMCMSLEGSLVMFVSLHV